MKNGNNEFLDDDWKKKFFRAYFDINVDNETLDKCLDYKNAHIPDSLFKYSKVRNVISLLSNDLMFLPRIEDLNDPFECSIFYDLDILLDNLNDYFYSFMDYSDFIDENATEEDISKSLKKIFKEPFEEALLELEDNYKNKLSIICLSEDYCINPMWAHYADNHKGVCIEYDLKNISELIFKHFCFPIEYAEKSDNTLELLSFFDENIKVNPNWILKLALMKSYDWKYENEWRIIVSQIIADYFNENNLGSLYFDEYYSDKHYIKFIKPKSIYLGLDMDLEDEKKLIDICKFRKINIYKMKKDKLGYNLKSEPIFEF
jgi:hypothetical protein